jgi:hypothetical protein
MYLRLLRANRINGGFAEPSGTFGSNLDRSLIGLEQSGVAKPRSS